MYSQIIQPIDILRPYISRYVFVQAEGSTDIMTPPSDDPRFVNGKHVQPLLPNYGSFIFIRNAVADISGTQTDELTLLGANQQTIGLTTVSGWFEGMMLEFEPGGMYALLGAVERGDIVLIGATTENPSFEVITPLLSRAQVFVLKSLSKEDLLTLLDRALKDDEVLRERNIVLKESDALLRQSGGDGRKLLNILEMVVDSQAGADQVVIDNKTVSECLQQSTAIYDKNGEMHYDIISAFIKSVRGSDPNAAVYYMARMLDGGEDPLFIARRLCILAAEDIGLANPNALLLANACFQVVNSIGMPEARIPLSETAIYLASSPKSNAAYMAIETAMQAAQQDQTAAVPLYLRNAPTKLMEELGYADGYRYAHDYPGHFTDLEFMPKGMEGTVFYDPQPNPSEDRLKAYLQACWPKYYSKK